MKNKNPVPTKADRKRAARAIASLMSNPATPTSLYESLVDELTFYNEFLDYDSPAVVEMSLNAYHDAVESGHLEIGEPRIDEPKTIG